MKEVGFSSADERWPLMAVLTWIATRSQKFAERWACSDPATAGRCLDDARKKDGAPYHISYADAFHALLEKSRSRDIAGSGSKIAWTAGADHEHLPLEQSFALAKPSAIVEACHFSPQEALNANYGEGHTLGLQDFTFHGEECLTGKGSGCGPPNLDGSRTRWTWKGVTFPREQVLSAWADFPCFSAWKQAKTLAWQLPGGISPDWLKTLPPGPYVSLPDAVDMLAFGPGRLPIGLSDLALHAARLRAGLSLMTAARQAKVTLLGMEATRHSSDPAAIVPAGSLREMGPEDLADIALVIDGAADWLGPTQFADDYPEIGHGANSVRFAGVRVVRASFRHWLSELSGKAQGKKRGPRVKYDWEALRREACRLMDEHGDFASCEPDWKQARLEEQLLAFYAQSFGNEPSSTELRKHIGPWLRPGAGSENDGGRYFN